MFQLNLLKNKMEEKKFPYKLKHLEENKNNQIKNDFTGYLTGGLTVEPSGYFFPGLYAQYAQRLYNFPLRDDDVFVASYPKSGEFFKLYI